MGGASVADVREKRARIGQAVGDTANWTGRRDSLGIGIIPGGVEDGQWMTCGFKWIYGLISGTLRN